MQTVLLAGASGHLGRHAARDLTRRGWRVRALARDPGRLSAAGVTADEVARGDLRDAGSLARAVAGVDAVLSCAGASMSLGMGDRTSFASVDFEGNRRLLEAARREGVRRFVYVSLFGGRELRATAYADAHERFVDALAASDVPHSVVRPTGYFSFFGEVLRMARQGRGPVLGSGEARTNPIHEADLAEVCAAALRGGEREIPVGGPVVHTRREIVEMALRAAGRRPRTLTLPPASFRVMGALMRPLQPRLAALLEFGAVVSQVDCVAPACGTRRLDHWFAEQVRGGAGAPTLAAGMVK